MKDNLRSACLLFLVFIIFTAGFVDLVSANDSNPYSFNASNYTGKWGSIDSPKSEYNIWGYTNKNYNFTTKYTCSQNFSKNTFMVFYWDCLNNTSNYNKTNYSQDKTVCNSWDKSGTYYVSVGIFENETAVNVSYWVPVRIINNNTTNVKLQNFYMLDENEGASSNKKIGSYFAPNLFNSQDSVNYYCAYVDNDYSFNAPFDASCEGNDSRQSIKEIITTVDWSNDTPPDYREINSSLVGNKNTVKWEENFTHKWYKLGENNITLSSFYWDPLDGNKKEAFNNITYILIIRDPKSFFLDSHNFILVPFLNLQNWGIFLVIIGLMILFFVFTKNEVPVTISLFGRKPFNLKSVDYFIGIFTFVAGLYLYFVFGRCPWDIPIIIISQRLQEAYFSMLYYEYAKQGDNAIPYLSILLGLVVVISLSTILYRVGIPIFNKLKSVKFLIIKGISMLRLSIFSFSLQFKEFSISMKENIRRINVTDGEVTRLQSESGKKEKM